MSEAFQSSKKKVPRPFFLRFWKNFFCVFSLFYTVLFFHLFASQADVTYFVDKQTIPQNRSQVIPFSIATPIDKTTSLEIVCQDNSLLKILRHPQIVKGHKIGYFQVYGLKPGKTTLTLANQSLPIEVVSSSASTKPTSRIKLVLPPTNSIIWGTFWVALDLEQDRSLLTHQSFQSLKPILHLSSGNYQQTISECKEITAFLPMTRRFLFKVDTDNIPTGLLNLQGKLALPSVAPQSPPFHLETASHSLFIVHPKASQIIREECETFSETLLPDINGKRPFKIENIDDSGTQKMVSIVSQRPGWTLPLSTKEKGTYQLIAMVKGDFGGGTFPSIALRLNEDRNFLGGSKILSNEWHRLPIGTPFTLEKGDHVLTLSLLKDFFLKNRGDRNFYLDHYELVRIDKLSPPSSLDFDFSSFSTSSTLNRSLRVAFTSPLEGKQITGKFIIRGEARYPSAPQLGHPKISLWINDQLHSSQVTNHADFKIFPHSLKTGSNKVQLQAELHGVTTKSVPQKIHFNPRDFSSSQFSSSHSNLNKPRPYIYHPVHPNWDSNFQKCIRPDGKSKLRKVAAFTSNIETSLQLPEDLQGRYNLYLDIKGDSYEGHPILKIDWTQNETKQLVKETEIQGGYRHQKIGTLQFTPGKKNLHLSFLNDHYKKNKGDRNIWIRKLILEPVFSTADKISPTAHILYPPPQSTLSSTHSDVVIVHAFDNREIKSVDLLVNGKPQRLLLKPRDGFGPVLLPLLTRNLSEGNHQLEIEVSDYSGNTIKTNPFHFSIKNTPSSSLNAYQRAVHLLNRFGFGPQEEQLISVLLNGEEKWLRSQLEQPSSIPSEQAILDSVLLSFPNDRNRYHVITRVLRQCLLTQHPARSRLVLWLNNHFTTWIRKTHPESKWDEYLRLSQSIPGSFVELLETSSTSPAMLFYLDQNRSFAKRINENYAREIMELHTLGVDGGYTQKDVTTLSHLLTGWMAVYEAYPNGSLPSRAQKEFHFDPALGEKHNASVIGLHLTGKSPEQRLQNIQLILDTLSSHPSTAHFITEKLIQHYVGFEIPDSFHQEISQTFMESGGNLTETLIAISQHPEFWKSVSSPRMMNPLDYSIRLARNCHSLDSHSLIEFLNRAGMALFDRATPDGYPEEDEAYADSNAMLQRWKFSEKMRWPLLKLIPPTWHGARDQQSQEKWFQEILDITSLRLTGKHLSPKSNEAALSVLSADAPNPHERMKRTAIFISQLPETNLK